jgi:hypothetical protein
MEPSCYISIVICTYVWITFTNWIGLFVPCPIIVHVQSFDIIALHDYFVEVFFLPLGTGI